MKEIDFLPEWYKSGQRRQNSYRTQYVALGGILVVMAVWNFVTAHSVSKASAGLAQMKTNQSQAQSDSIEFAEVMSELKVLHKKVNTLDEIDSKIDVVRVLAEMSYLIDKKIVLRRVEFSAERFADEGGGKSGRAVTAVRAATRRGGGKDSTPLGNVRFKVAISGVASDTSDVTELVCRLEDSPYFGPVVSSMHNSEITVGDKSEKETYQISEFEMSCYLANYKESTSGG